MGNTNERKELATSGTMAAAKFLERERNMEIIARNWRCKAGAIDLIAHDEDGTLVFVEVKTRKSGLPADVTTSEKRDRLERIAASFLATSHVIEEIRFDMISLLVIAPDRALLRYHRNCWGSEA